jgi:hypothetical protein
MKPISREVGLVVRAGKCEFRQHARSGQQWRSKRWAVANKALAALDSVLGSSGLLTESFRVAKDAREAARIAVYRTRLRAQSFLLSQHEPGSVAAFASKFLTF